MLEETVRFVVALILIGLATASITVTLTQSLIFEGFRNRCSDFTFVSKLISCPYCAAHWLSFGLAAQVPGALTAGILGYLLTTMMLVTVTTLFVGAINKALA